jgi:hypothetical protein
MLEGRQGWKRAAEIPMSAKRPLPWLLCIQHVPFIAEHPTKRRELAVNHSPFEIIPWPQVLDAVFPLDFLAALRAPSQMSR